MKKTYIMAAMAALALTACDDAGDLPQASEVAARISASIGETDMTRAFNTSWQDNDKIGITTTTGLAAEPFVNIEYTKSLADGVLFEGKTIYIYNPMTLTAYYPYSDAEGSLPGDNGVISATTTAAFQTPADQPKIDFLYDKVTDITTDDPEIKFVFSHRMAKLSFKFRNGDGMEVSKITSYELAGFKLAGKFNVMTGDCAADAGVAAENLTIATTDVQDSRELPYLILFPQSLGAEGIKITITDSDNQIYTGTLFANRKLESGNHYLYTITVSKAGVDIQQPEIIDWSPVDIDGDAGSSE